MIRVELHGEVETIARLDEQMRGYLDALRKAIKIIGYRREARVKNDKLSGQVLNRRTGRLSASVNTEFFEDANSISTKTGIPKDMRYGFIHEYGGTFTVKEHLRMITQAWGRPISPRAVTVRSHEVTFPVRSFLRSTMREDRQRDIATIHAEIAKVKS